MQMNDSGLDNCPLNVTIAFKNYVQFVTYQHKSSVIARIKDREREREKKKSKEGKTKRNAHTKCFVFCMHALGKKTNHFHRQEPDGKIRLLQQTILLQSFEEENTLNREYISAPF